MAGISFDQLIWVDYFVLVILALSAFIGLWRGFVREVLSLATWVAAFAVTVAFAQPVADYLEPYVSVPSVRTIIACGALFLGVLFIGGILLLIMTRLIKFTGLSGTDRLIGFFFGVARGAAVVVALVMLAGLTPLPADPWWRESTLLPYFEALSGWVAQQFPEGMSQQFDFSQLAPDAAEGEPAFTEQPETILAPDDDAALPFEPAVPE